MKKKARTAVTTKKRKIKTKRTSPNTAPKKDEIRVEKTSAMKNNLLRNTRYLTDDPHQNRPPEFNIVDDKNDEQAPGYHLHRHDKV